MALAGHSEAQMPQPWHLAGSISEYPVGIDERDIKRAGPHADQARRAAAAVHPRCGGTKTDIVSGQHGLGAGSGGPCLDKALADCFWCVGGACYKKAGNRQINRTELDMIFEEIAVIGARQLEDHRQFLGGILIGDQTGAEAEAVGTDGNLPCRESDL